MKKILLLATVLLAAVFHLSAQQGPGSGPGGVSLTQFFGANNAFSADCELAVTNSDNIQVVSGTMKYAMLGNKVRTEVDMTKMNNSQAPVDAIQNLQKMGMAKALSITRPDQKLVYLIYPDLKSYAHVPAPAAVQPPTNGTPQIQLTKLGAETIDGHPCVKNQATVTGDDGQSHQAILWNATDLKNFPLQIQSTEQGMTANMHFKNINLTRPAAALFDPPTGYTAYDDMQSMMLAVMQKSMKSAPAPAPAPASMPTPQ
jgi:hypothetical protein